MSRKSRTHHAPKAPLSSPWGHNPHSKNIGTSILDENSSQSGPINLVISRDEELDLSEKLTDLHYRYFGRSKKVPVLPEDIGISGFPEVKRLFQLYDTARNTRRTKRKFDELALHLAVLLGLKRSVLA